GELVGRAARVGGLDGGTQGARAGVGQGGDGQTDLRGQPTIFERLQPRPEVCAGRRMQGPAPWDGVCCSASQPGRDPQETSPFENGSAGGWKALTPGAQTGRRGGAGPAGELAWRQNLTGRFFFNARPTRRYLKVLPP